MNLREQISEMVTFVADNPSPVTVEVACKQVEQLIEEEVNRRVRQDRKEVLSSITSFVDTAFQHYELLADLEKQLSNQTEEEA